VERQIEALAAFVAAPQWEDVPPSAQHHNGLVRLDALGVILVRRLPIWTTSLLQAILAARTIDTGWIPSLRPLSIGRCEERVGSGAASDFAFRKTDPCSNATSRVSDQRLEARRLGADALLKPRQHGRSRQFRTLMEPAHLRHVADQQEHGQQRQIRVGDRAH
jgi:hypothetical protein